MWWPTWTPDQPARLASASIKRQNHTANQKLRERTCLAAEHRLGHLNCSSTAAQKKHGEVDFKISRQTIAISHRVSMFFFIF